MLDPPSKEEYNFENLDANFRKYHTLLKLVKGNIHLLPGYLFQFLIAIIFQLILKDF